MFEMKRQLQLFLGKDVYHRLHPDSGLETGQRGGRGGPLLGHGWPVVHVAAALAQPRWPVRRAQSVFSLYRNVFQRYQKRNDLE